MRAIHYFLTWLRGLWLSFLLLTRRRWLAPYVDDQGQGWRERPDWQDATAPDRGQHESWKRDMRIFLHRYRNRLPEAPGVLPLSEVGLGDRLEQVPVLFPVGLQLAAVSRKLGYLALARAAMPEAEEAALLAAYSENEHRVQLEAVRRFAQNRKTAESWSPAWGGFNPDSEEETVTLLTLGPLESVAGAAPLEPIRLSAAEPPDYRQFTRPKR